MTIETLTDADRDRLDYKGERKALHIIDAANARIAELERYTEAQKAVVLEARRDRTAANARAEAAEQNARHCVECMVQAEGAQDSAESEAAALRADAKQANELRAIAQRGEAVACSTANSAVAEAAALRAQVGAANEATKSAVIRWQRAESEAEDLRAEVERPWPDREAELAAAERRVLDAARAYASADMPSDGTKKALLDACRVGLRRAIRG